MVEQPPKDAEIERLLKNKTLIEHLYEQILGGEVQPGPGVETVPAGEPFPVPELTEGVRVFYCNRYITNEDLRDALDRPFDALFMRGRRGLLLLVDPDPTANWAHACWIASIDTDHGEVRIVWNDYPPRETPEKRLVRYPAPQPPESERKARLRR